MDKTDTRELTDFLARLSTADNHSGRREVIALIAARDGLNCGICEQPLDPAGGVSLDHVVPRSHGGPDHFDNRRMAHYSCDTQRGNKDCPLCKIGACLGSRHTIGLTAPRNRLTKKQRRRRAQPDWVLRAEAAFETAPRVIVDLANLFGDGRSGSG